MAEVMDAPPELEPLDRRRDRQPDRREESPDDLPPPPRRRDRDSRERREERDGRRYHDRTRERDYKRRFSPSPPPHRRHSPPRRSSPPPPFKRSRRDDGGHDNRRGSPRFNYDYGGGYDRNAMGSRGAYPEDRPHGRYMNRQSDLSDSGHTGSADIPSLGVTQREGLMSYKQFIQELEDDILPAEAERRYEEYRSEYISTQKRAYFAAHKDEEWLKNKYHPTNLVTVIERRNELARTVVAKEFLLNLQNGTLDLGPGVTASLAMQSGQVSDADSEDEADTGGKRKRHGRGPTKENAVSSAAPKAPPVSAEPRRIEVDIEQAQALVRKLDKEKGIVENVLCGAHQDKGSIIIIRGLTAVKGLEGIELLDTVITYLWRVHGLDYYGMREMDEAKGLRHVRSEGKSYDERNIGGADWENKLDSFWQGRLHGQDPLERMTAKEKIDAAAFEALDPCVRKIRDEKYGWKYGCGAKGCTKLFHAAEFVHKHLKLKHPDLVLELTSKVREDLYFQNYMNDADAPGSKPIMQLPILKDKSQRRKPGLDSRLRDDRSNHRGHGRADNINSDERYNTMENSPSRNYESNTNELEAGNLNDPMYDNYGEGLHGAPYPSDIPPPPVLMPVPGAGPLGPFVPAPPEVAMRMLRDQGGPSPYEDNGGSRGRKGRLAPQVGGPAPILPISPAFRQDPRRIRSYQDLDAPEDEVTVIDYRSL